MGVPQSHLCGAEQEAEENLRKKGKDVEKFRERLRRMRQRRRKPKVVDIEEAPTPDTPVDVGRFNLRVGKMVWAQPHPLAKDSHYLHYVYLKGNHWEVLISELAKHYTPEQLNYEDTERGEEKGCVVLCNIKPRKVFGYPSDYMVMCAHKEDKIELIFPPDAAQANEKILVPGYPRRPDDPYMKPYKKIYETVVEDLRVNDQKQVVYKDVPLQVEGREGFITTETLTDCPVSVCDFSIYSF